MPTNNPVNNPVNSDIPNEVPYVHREPPCASGGAGGRRTVDQALPADDPMVKTADKVFAELYAKNKDSRRIERVTATEEIKND